MLNQGRTKTFSELNRLNLKEFLNELNIGFHKHSVVEDYRLTRDKLGTGINGSVIKVTNRKNGTNGALKIIYKASRNAETEIKLHAYATQCQNVVKILDVFENQYRNRPCFLLIMECMAGGELFEQIQKTKITERDAATIMRQIGTAVQFLHNRNIAHRDLKPENLLYETKSSESSYQDNKLKLIDFGFAKEVSTKGLQTPCFTPYYAAPEVLNESERYNMSCDIWSIGVIMYVLLCGYPPFYSATGVAISPGMKQRIRQGEYTFPDDDWKNVTQTAKDLIRSMLTVDVNKRIDIDVFMRSPWIALPNEVPTTPLVTSRNLMDDEDCLKSTQQEMEAALNTMRVDEPTKEIKNPKTSNNKLLERRKKKKLEKLDGAKVNSTTGVSAYSPTSGPTMAPKRKVTTLKLATGNSIIKEEDESAVDDVTTTTTTTTTLDNTNQKTNNPPPLTPW